MKEALKMALEALKGVLDDSPKVMEASISGGLYEVVQCRDAIKALEQALAEQHLQALHDENVRLGLYEQRSDNEQLGGPVKRCCPHDSDCAVHNMPAYPAGACDCTYKNTFNTPPSAKIHEVCLKLAEQELDKLTAENFGRTPNDAWTNKIVDVYHFFDSNPKAKNLTVLYTKAHQPKQEQGSTTCDKPVAWLHPDWPDGYSGFQAPVTTYMTNGWIPLYTAPQQRTWVDG
jgi:hypothetical protein